MQTEQIYQHQAYLMSYALNRTGDEDLAKDLVQETYLAALQSRQPYAERSTLRTWLVGILKNKAYDAYRKQMKEREKVAQLPTELSQEMFRPHHELIPLVTKVIRQLPPVWQRVFTMNDLEERPAAEICETLNLTPANYWVISHRARRSLRENLRAYR